MPMKLVPTEEPFIFKLMNMWPNENKWISFSNDGSYLYARYENESDAMPIKFVPTGEPNTFKMLNMWGGQANKWISFTNDGSWIRAIYNSEHDAMPVRLHFKGS
eukprot:12148273-Ditylum_brightwellii.AAC.1